MANAIAKCQIFVSRCEPNTAQPNAAVATACQNDDRITYCRPAPLRTMCPTAFLAPTLTAKTCLSALSHKMHFFWPSLRCKVIEQMVKSRYLVEFPAQKKEPKWFQNLGRFKKNSSCSVAKKSPKNWTGPCLISEKGSSSGKRHREMPNLRFKVRTQHRPAQCSSGDRLPERRSYHVL